MQIRKSFVLLIACLAFVAGQTVVAQNVHFALEGRAGSGLLPGNETGNSNSTGSGDVLTGIIFNTNTSELFIDVGWGSGNGFTDLTGSATGMHIHGPADFNSNAGVLYPLSGLPGFNDSATNGGFTGTISIDPGDVRDLLNGLHYINVHTAANGPGEIRGNLVRTIPEPSTAAILGVFGITVFIRHRKRI